MLKRGAGNELVSIRSHMPIQISRVPQAETRLRRTIDQIIAALNSVVTTLVSSVTQTGNAAATETNLFSFTVPGGTLAAAGDSLEFAAAGRFAATASTNKVIKVIYGATTIYDSGSLAITTANSWSLRGSVTQVSLTVQKTEVVISTSSSVLVSFATYATAAEDLSTAIVLRVRGNGTNVSDVIGERWKVLRSPAV